MIPRPRRPQAGCQVCLGVGEVLDPPLPGWCADGGDVIAWADAMGAKNVPCRACQPAQSRDRNPDTPGATPARKIAQIGSYEVTR
jgi:hypothetical protein